MAPMRYRAPVLADAPSAYAVLRARQMADFGVPIYTLEDLLDEWQGGALELDHDARVVEADGGQLVAYAAVRRHGTLAAVAPGHEGRGIGTRLLGWTQQRERENGHPLHRQWVGSANASARALLTRAGYARARSYWRLVRPLDGHGPAPAASDGVQVRGIDIVRDAERLHALDEASFASAPDYVPESLETFREQHLQAHDSAPELSLVAEDGERPVAFLLARRRPEESTGFIALLAVEPAHQRRGIGTTLLQRAFAGFAAAGLRQAKLMVASDNPRALHVYERAGMVVELQIDIYERPVASPRAR